MLEPLRVVLSTLPDQEEHFGPFFRKVGVECVIARGPNERAELAAEFDPHVIAYLHAHGGYRDNVAKPAALAKKHGAVFIAFYCCRNAHEELAPLVDIYCGPVAVIGAVSVAARLHAAQPACPTLEIARSVFGSDIWVRGRVLAEITEPLSPARLL